MRIACLYRVSTKKQVEENDIPMQKNACREFIASKDEWKLVKEYSEKGVSGYHKSAAQRDVLQQVKVDAEKELFDVLLVFMFDRLGRREDETPFVVEWFVAKGIEVWSVKEGQQKFDSRVDKLMNYIRFWQSGGESEKTSIRVAEKHKQMVEEGKFRGGCPAFGYTFVKSGYKNKKGYELNKLVIDENESEVVKTIFNLVTEYGYGGHKIATYLNNKGILTKNSNYWTASSVNSLLKNPIYKGQYVSGKRKSERGMKKRTKPEEWIYSKELISELAIVDEEVWKKAEDIRNARNGGNREYPSQTKGVLLFVGLAYCGCCGNRMTSRYAVKKWIRKKDGESIRYLQPKYICQKRSSIKPCNGQSSYSQRKIDPVVLDEIYTYLNMLDEIDLSEKVVNIREDLLKASQKQLIRIESQIKKTGNELVALKNEIVKCLMGESHFSEQQLSKIIFLKENQLEELQFEKEQKVHEMTERNNDDKAFKGMIHNWQFEFDEAPKEIKKMLISRLIEDMHIYPDKVVVRFKFNLFGVH